MQQGWLGVPLSCKRTAANAGVGLIAKPQIGGMRRGITIVGGLDDCRLHATTGAASVTGRRRRHGCKRGWVMREGECETKGGCVSGAATEVDVAAFGGGRGGERSDANAQKESTIHPNNPP